MALVNSKLNSANSIEDVEATHQLMLELVDCAPADRKEIFRQKIEKDFADPAAILEKIRKQRGDK